MSGKITNLSTTRLLNEKGVKRPTRALIEASHDDDPVRHPLILVNSQYVARACRDIESEGPDDDKKFSNFAVLVVRNLANK
jgi:hypothetical protein